MKKEIIVRKSRGRRLGLVVIFAVMASLCVLSIVLLYPLYHFGCLSLIGILPLLCVLLYYETWRVSINHKNITISYLGRHITSYSYYQIKDAYITNSYTLHQHICLTFFDNKKLIIRMDDENANKAVKIIQSHCSLRSLNW